MPWEMAAQVWTTTIVMFSKGSADSKGERFKTSIAALPTNGLSYGQMSNLVASVVTNSEPMTKLSTLPIIKTRTKKLVQEELAKRARKIEQQRQLLVLWWW
jgi:hypothetical protein